jgi:hypothetical protein
MALQSIYFNFLSEGTIDRVVFVKEDSTVYPTGTTGNYVDIEVPYTSELMLVQASVSVDGQSWYSEDSPRYGTGTGTDLSISSHSYSGKIRISLQAPPGITKVYYRVVGIKL